MKRDLCDRERNINKSVGGGEKEENVDKFSYVLLTGKAVDEEHSSTCIIDLHYLYLRGLEAEDLTGGDSRVYHTLIRQSISIYHVHTNTLPSCACVYIYIMTVPSSH